MQLELVTEPEAFAPAAGQDTLSASTVGRIGELLVEAELLRRGFRVARESVDDGVDLFVDRRVSVQVKASKLTSIHGYRFHVFASPRQRWGADVFVFVAFGREYRLDCCWVVPGAFLRADGVAGALSLYRGARGRSERFAPFLDAWEVFDAV